MESPRSAKGFAVAALVAAIGLGAFLLFEIQFLVAKWLLPWFGGAASVWTTCMLFFQVGLLAGYVYAHALSTRLRPAWQAAVHLGLLALAIVVLAVAAWRWPSAVTPDLSWRPGPDVHPIQRLLLLLSISVGIPYAVLSTTGPLLQSWFVRLRPGGSPYRLYALSNAGSLLGVIAYPIAVEPLLSVETQGTVWSILFGVYAFLVGLAALAFSRTGPARDEERPLEDVRAASSVRLTEASAPVFWWALSIVTSLGLLSVTSQLTLDVGVVPFLWMVPLIVYLGTFIWAFSAPGRFSHDAWGAWLVAGSVAAALVLARGNDVPLSIQVPTYLVFLLLLCAFGHGELARRKPEAGRLTAFYLALAGGGAVGGVIAAILAPLLFRGLWELPITLYAGMLLPILSVAAAGRGPLVSTPRRAKLFLAGSGTFLFGAALALSLAQRESPFVIRTARSFYGYITVSRWWEPVKPPAVARHLMHGTTFHGLQFEAEPFSRLPTAYYGPGSGVGRVLGNHPRRVSGEGRRPLRVGVVGLGVGTLAAWGLPGDVFRFYELNPDVIRLSEPPEPVFTYLSRSRARIEVVRGDARLSMEREPAQALDVLVLDAFTSDAIPVHLLTLEAFDVYRRHLRGPDSVIAVHVSNRNFRLAPVVSGVARRRGFVSAEVVDPGNLPVTAPSDWVLLASSPGPLSAPGIGATVDRGDASALPYWTDTRSNLFESLAILARQSVGPEGGRN